MSAAKNQVKGEAMTVKLKIKVSIDIIMTGLLFVLMSYQYIGEEKHEIAGTAMFVLFILHHILNQSWYKNLHNGKYSVSRVIQTLTDILLFADMVGLMVSGIAMSRHVLHFLKLDINQSFARELHMTASYVGFLLMGFHIGLHFGMIMNMVRRMSGIEKNQDLRTWSLRIAAACVAVYGAYALIQRELLAYILQIIKFAFFNYDEPTVSFFVDYVSIMGLMIFLAYYLQEIILWKRDKVQ